MAIITSVAIAMSLHVTCNKEKTVDVIEATNSINDSLEHYKNKYHQVITEKSSIVLDFNIFKDIKNKELAELKKVVTQHTQSATNFETETQISGVTKTITLNLDSNSQTSNCDGIVYSVNICDSAYNELTKKYDTTLVGEISSAKDSTKYKLIVFDNITVDQSWTKFSLLHPFKKQELKTSIVHTNPLIKTTTIQSYSKPIPKKEILLGIGTGVVATAIAFLLYSLK